MKKIGAIRPILLTTRRPSNRISGTSLKSEFKRTIFAIWRVAGSPSAITMEQSVTGLSPEMILRSTPWERKYSRVSEAPSRMGSVISITAIPSRFSGSFNSCMLISSELWAKTSTRDPRACASTTAAGFSLRSISGAPRKTVPRLDRCMAPHFRSLEKGIMFSAV